MPGAGRLVVAAGPLARRDARARADAARRASRQHLVRRVDDAACGPSRRPRADPWFQHGGAVPVVPAARPPPRRQHGRPRVATRQVVATGARLVLDQQLGRRLRGRPSDCRPPGDRARCSSAGAGPDVPRWCRTAPSASSRPAVEPLQAWSLAPRRYGLVIARPEPENSVLEIVRAWSLAAPPVSVGGAGRVRGGASVPRRGARAPPGPDVIFPGALYDARGGPGPAPPRAAVRARPHRRRHQPVTRRSARRRIAGAGARQRLQSLGGRRWRAVLRQRERLRARAGDAARR